jgi:Uma2 family endonuclease
MSTKKKTIKYEFSEENETFAEETFMQFPVLDLDLTKRYTYADYLTWIDFRLRELINGFIHLVKAPLRVHQRVSGKLYYTIDDFIRKNNGQCHVYHLPFAVRFPIEDSKEDNKIYNVFLPDICVVCDLSKLDDQGCLGAPDLVIEILSPSTARNDWNRKFGVYEKAGVREYWIVSPKGKTVNVFILQPNGEYDWGSEYDCTQKIPVHIFEGLEIDLQEVFED